MKRLVLGSKNMPWALPKRGIWGVGGGVWVGGGSAAGCLELVSCGLGGLGIGVGWGRRL